MNGKNTYEEFKEILQGRLQEEYTDGEVYIQSVRKNNNTRKEGIIVWEKGEEVVSGINLKALYRCYQEMGDMELCVQLVKMLVSKKKELNLESIPATWEECRGRITMRLIHTEWNREYLQTVPHIEFLDLSVTFYLMLQKLEEGICTIPITNAFMEFLGISIEELHQEGLQNLMEKGRFEIHTLNAYMAELLEEGQDEPETVQTISEDSYVMLSDNRIFGSSGMLATETLMEFAERRNDDFYILPCSVHELILVLASTNVSPDYLREVVQEVNEESVLPEERLSDAVYYFSRESGMVQLAGE